jgi:hypothetical protein
LLLSLVYPVYCTAGGANCTAKKALNEDQYDECGLLCFPGLPIPIPICGTHTRYYVNGHPTNWFDGHPGGYHRYRDPGCAAEHPLFIAKKVG